MPHSDNSTSSPTLAVVSGPPGTGKTTLAQKVAQGLGCPAIIRDEIKQGMVLATPGYRSGGDDPLNHRTLDVFFEVLTSLLRAGTTVVAEAAFQDKLWRSGLEPLAALARIRVVRCTTSSAVARSRIAQRARASAHRGAHADQELLDAMATGKFSYDRFTPISLDVPILTVDTSSGYRPGVKAVEAFLRDSAWSPTARERRQAGTRS
ncbi:AAA family ATPase [Streptomyces sp. DT24]|uniref:AAA family ATPase n=1 Tax=unclassified Streptomyces TaxID=2593676 RepID=UPI0023BA340E|nr:ATP-binding protein [Streptomyces sp. AM 4-1-1]WEH36319.1 ATP-binding protein [Streptomyces sp. AM 4-1-1]